MDLLEKGKEQARHGQHAEALDLLILALENDKENPDIHFYLGLCYSALEQFPYAKHHYQLVKVLKPDYPKLNLVWDGLKEFEPENPPERRIARSAAAKMRKQTVENREDETPAKSFDTISVKNSHEQIKITDAKWEKAFPTDQIMKPSTEMSTLQIIAIAVVGIAVLGTLVYVILSILFNPTNPASF
ncbi:MAG: hypothetical protein C4527_25055 [Candidatus Omnitrophota bacterium]|jgi:tetratricopeptide (TPR) repeat protein|nr:MAG: hypothetical protein C4527_25055 [Candidatus Omnitrophota bacterium]